MLVLPRIGAVRGERECVCKAAAGSTPRALRFHEADGLAVPSAAHPGGQRGYGPPGGNPAARSTSCSASASPSPTSQLRGPPGPDGRRHAAALRRARRLCQPDRDRPAPDRSALRRNRPPQRAPRAARSPDRRRAGQNELTTSRPIAISMSPCSCVGVPPEPVQCPSRGRAPGRGDPDWVLCDLATFRIGSVSLARLADSRKLHRRVRGVYA